MYVSEFERVVLKALREAYSLYERAVSVEEIREVGNAYTDLPEIEIEGLGIFTPFDMWERTQRLLGRLVRKGLQFRIDLERVITTNQLGGTEDEFC